jgi:hypothetical protein
MSKDTQGTFMTFPTGWHSRGYLPHYSDAGTTQFITFRLADSRPLHVIDDLKRRLRNVPSSNQRWEQRVAIKQWLDQGHGSCILSGPKAAQIVANALWYFDGNSYTLHSWVVMPHHVHALLTELGVLPLSQVVKSWKTHTSRKIHEEFRFSGQLWQRGYFDRYIRIFGGSWNTFRRIR